jgi:hypothetical protein
MKKKHPKIALVLLGNTVLSTLLLSISIAFGTPAPFNIADTTSTKTLSNQERLEIEQLREQKRVLERIQAENLRTYTRNTILFNVVLGALALLLAAAIAALLLLRRAVMREIADLARSQLNELKGLDKKITEANQTVQNVLEKAEDMVEELEQEQVNFQEDLGIKKSKIFNLLSELQIDIKEQTKVEMEVLKKSEVEFVIWLDEIQKNLQKQRDVIAQDLEQVGSEFPHQVLAIQSDLQSQKNYDSGYNQTS